MITLDAEQQSKAVDYALAESFLARHMLGRERVVLIADIVFERLSKIPVLQQLQDDTVSAEEYEGILVYIENRVKQSSTYPEIKGAIPVWLIAIIAQMVIKLLVEWWFTQQGLVVIQRFTQPDAEVLT